MAGPLQGIAAGIQAGTALNQDQQGLDLRAAAEQRQQAQVDREAAREKAKDGLSAVQEQLSGIAQGALPARNILAGAANADDPAAYRNSDEYKTALQTVKDSDSQAQQLSDVRAKHLSTLAGYHIADSKDRAQTAAYKLATQGPDAVTGGDLLDAVSLKTKMPPNVYVRGPDGAPSAAEQANQDLAEAYQSGNFDTPQALRAAANLMPELHLGVGQQSPDGGTVVGAAPAGLHYDPADHNYLLVTKNVTKHMPDGSYAQSQTPPMADGSVRIKVSDLVDRWKQSQALTQQLAPVQKKLHDALINGDTALHRYDQDLAEAGVPEDQRLTNYKTSNIPKGGGVMVQAPGQQPKILQAPDNRTASEKAISDYMDANPDANYDDAQRAISNYKHGYQDGGGKDPNLRSSRGGGSRGGGSSDGKYSEADKKELEDTLSRKIALAHGMPENATLDRGETWADKVPKANRGNFLTTYNTAKLKLRNDVRSKKPDVDPDAYVPKATGPAPATVAGAGPPISALTEGKNQRFANGQVWTLKSGKPVQVQ